MTSCIAPWCSCVKRLVDVGVKELLLATPLLGSLAGAALALAAGWWSLREVLRRPVAQTLRQAGE